MKIITDIINWVIPTVWFIGFVIAECAMIYGVFKLVGAI
jgi:hypothetical protein